MSLFWAVGLFGLGLVTVIVSAEWLVEVTTRLSYHLGVSTFLLSVVFLGFDPENLGIGAVASYEATSGIALGTIVGSAMVALALALGVTALIVPLKFDRVPRRILLVLVIPILLLTGLAVDGVLSRLDGVVLLLGYVAGITAIVRWERQGIKLTSREEVDAPAERRGAAGIARSAAWFIASLVGVVVGSEALLRGARPIIEGLGWTDTLFGMTLLALLVSVEEVARELPAALKGRPDIAFGNVVGSALAFFCFNAGVIALVRPIPVGPVTRQFYLPVCAGAILLIGGLMAWRQIPRLGGALLLILYGVYVLAPMLGVV